MAKGKARKTQKKRTQKKRIRQTKKVGNYATVQQTISFSAGTNPNTNAIQKMYNFSLSNCDRAVQVARGFAYYRIKKVQFTFKPSSDTYAAGAAASVPNLYVLIDKTGNFYNQNINFNSMRDAGCKPIRFDDKNIKRSFKPAVPMQGFNFDTSQFPWTMTKTSPWIACNRSIMQLNPLPTQAWLPNSTDHYGIVFGVEQDYGSIQKYDVDITYTYEFKKPAWQSLGASVPNIVHNLNDPLHTTPAEDVIVGLPTQDL